MRPDKDTIITKKMIGLLALVAILSAIIAQIFSELALAAGL